MLARIARGPFPHGTLNSVGSGFHPRRSAVATCSSIALHGMPLGWNRHLRSRFSEAALMVTGSRGDPAGLTERRSKHLGQTPTVPERASSSLGGSSSVCLVGISSSRIVSGRFL